MTGACTIAGEPRQAERWTLREPRTGQWVALVRVPYVAAAVGDDASIDDTWFGVIRDVVHEGQLSDVMIAAGKDALRALVPPQYLAGGCTTQTVLALLCAAAGESPAQLTATGLPSWRTRGESLVYELMRLARVASGGLWRYLPSGLITLEPDPATTPELGTQLRADGDAAVYALDTLAPLAGGTVDGYTVDVALYTYRGTGQPTVALWTSRAPLVQAGPSIGGTVQASRSAGRVDVRADDGAQLADVPLYTAPGYACGAAPGTRVLIVDLGDDPRQTVAFAGADGDVEAQAPLGPAITLARGESQPLSDPVNIIGRVVRYGDKVLCPVLAADVTLSQLVPSKCSRVKA